MEKKFSSSIKDGGVQRVFIFCSVNSQALMDHLVHWYSYSLDIALYSFLFVLCVQCMYHTNSGPLLASILIYGDYVMDLNGWKLIDASKHDKRYSITRRNIDGLLRIRMKPMAKFLYLHLVCVHFLHIFANRNTLLLILNISIELQI